MPRRLVSKENGADYLRVSVRTIENYIGAGYFPAYRITGQRGYFVDLDEVDAAVRTLPPGTIKPGVRRFGPKARIHDLPARPVVVTAEDEQ